MRSLKLAVIGDPIAHTLSPQIHHAIAGKLGVDCSYTAHHVPLAQLESFVEMVRREGFDGFNITIPHKQNIIPYLAGLDPYAASCGAVNTVRIQDGNLYGYNTDGDGLKAALAAHGIHLGERKVLLLGAGGAALSICRKAVETGAEVHLLCRDPRKAAAFRGPHVTIGAMDRAGLCWGASQADLLINATPLGMSGIPDDFTDLSFLDGFSGAVCDIVYKPAETTLLRESRQRGLLAMNGLGMLIYQAVYAFSIFLGESFDLDEMAAHVTKVMEQSLYGG